MLQKTCDSWLKGSRVHVLPSSDLLYGNIKCQNHICTLRIHTVASCTSRLRCKRPWLKSGWTCLATLNATQGSHGPLGTSGNRWHSFQWKKRDRRLERTFVSPRALSWRFEDVPADVGILMEGSLGTDGHADQMDSLRENLYRDAIIIVQHAIWYLSNSRMEHGEEVAFPRPVELSLVLCDDDHIQGLNKEWRNMDKATDVLAFEMNDDDSFECISDIDEGFGIQEDALDNNEDGENGNDGDPLYAFAGGEPVIMLGDVVISIDTAQRQANERGHTLLDECRILLIHGVLHLLGYDHEYSEEEAEQMHNAEISILRAAGFRGDSGLIGFGAEGEIVARSEKVVNRSRSSNCDNIKLLCLDMDGTLLNSQSELLPSSVEALKMVADRGVQVILATGKARPAAMRALEKVGLAGDGKHAIVGTKTPGIFLQGLEIYGAGGAILGGGSLDMSIAKKVLSYAEENNVSVSCFLGDECVTTRMTKELEELHYRYYEPYPNVLSVEDILAGPSIRKILLMDDPKSIKTLRAHMDTELLSTGAGTMQAVETMLEIIPRGFNKWTALQLLMSHFDGVTAENVMAIGDGENDLEMIQGAGVGIAMGNAVASVKDSATMIVSSNDDGGIHEAIEHFVR